MATDFRAGLTDQDELSQYPSAANPLDSMGIDPDYARANPEILDRLSRGGGPIQPERKQQAPYAPVDTPSLNDVSAPEKPATAPPSASASAEPTDPEGYGMQGLGMLSKNMQDATKAAGEVPTQTPDEITSLSERRAKLATPAQRFDPSTGKQLTSTQEYDPDTGKMVTINPKASTGSKVWRGVRGGLVGLMTGGIPGAIVGAVEPQDIAGGKAYSAPSKQYEQAEQRREQALASTDDQLKNARETWKQAVDASGKKASEYRANAALGKDLTTGATGLINAEENKPEAEARKGQAKLELSQKEFEQRQKNLQTDPNLSQLSPLNKMLYMANGKVPDPKEPNEAEINAAQIARAMTVFKAQHGGKTPQTLEEFNSVISAAKGSLDKGTGKANPQQLRLIEDKKTASIERANKDFANSSNVDPKDAAGEYQKQLQTIQDGYENELASQGYPVTHQAVTVDDKGQVKWTPAAGAPAAAPAAPSAPPSPAAAQNQPASTPKPSPDGTRIKLANGTIQIKRDGKWVNE